MSKVAARPTRETLFRRLAAATDESAAVQLLVTLCRNSPELCHWLWEDFARDAATRDAFAAALRRVKPDALTRFADITGDGRPWRDTARRLRAQLHGARHGGLTRREVETLLVEYQAGKTDAAAFLLARQWTRLRRKTRVAPRLLQTAFAFLDAVLHEGDTALLPQLSKAARQTGKPVSRLERRAQVGYSDWWKLHTLLYLLRHPAPSYRTRELGTYLRELGLNVSVKEIRRFLARHAIRRDMRAGRPRTRHPNETTGSKTQTAAGGSG
jgi:hypothetical protein